MRTELKPNHWVCSTRKRLSDERVKLQQIDGLCRVADAKRVGRSTGDEALALFRFGRGRLREDF